MANWLVAPLGGVLAKARSCCEVLEAAAPLAEQVLAESSQASPHLFFMTQDGQDGMMKLAPDAIDRLSKDEQAESFRRFCAVRGVRACAFLATGKTRAPSVSSNDEAQRQPMEKTEDRQEDRAAKVLDALSAGVQVAFLTAEYLGEAERICIWKLDSMEVPKRLEEVWNKETSRIGGRFTNLLGQGGELGFPVADDIRDLFVACSNRKTRSGGQVRSFSNGPTPGEVICDTTEEKAWIRLVEKAGTVLLVGLLTGQVIAKGDKAAFVVGLTRDHK